MRRSRQEIFSGFNKIIKSLLNIGNYSGCRAKMLGIKAKPNFHAKAQRRKDKDEYKNQLTTDITEKSKNIILIYVTPIW